MMTAISVDQTRLLPALVVAASILLGACAMGPDYQSALSAAPGQQSFIERDQALFSTENTSDEDQDPWWKLYQDETLESLVTEALDANRDLLAASANLERAQAVLNQSRSQRLPDVGVDASQIRSRQNFFLDQPIAVQNNISSVNLSMAYQLDLFGRVRRAIEASRASAEAMEAAYLATYITVAAETARAYAEVCAAGHQLQVALRSQALQSRSHELTVQLRDAGRGTGLDVASAAAALAQTSASIPGLRAGREAALYRLAVLMGREPADYPRQAEDCQAPLALAQVIPVGDGTGLLRRRPDVRQAERELAAATARVGMVAADFYPSVSFGGSIGSAALSMSDLGAGDFATWSYGPRINWAFPNIAGNLARKAQAEAEVEVAKARFDGTWLNALRETESTLSAYTHALDTRDALGDARDHARQAASLAQARYEAGQLNFLDVVRTELQLTQAEMDLAQAEAAIANLRIGLFLALGGGWQQL